MSLSVFFYSSTEVSFFIHFLYLETSVFSKKTSKKTVLISLFLFVFIRTRFEKVGESSINNSLIKHGQWDEIGGIFIIGVFRFIYTTDTSFLSTDIDRMS